MTYSLHELDDKLLKYLFYENGFFIEAGANDGISQSNTLLFEQKLKWSGILIEPNLYKANLCKINRANSIVEHCALVSKHYSKNYIEGDFDHKDYAGSLMSMVIDEGDECDLNYQTHKNYKKNNEKIVSVPAKTLTSILEFYKIKTIDLLSLDVEGYEISVLNGLDFLKFSPIYCLIETTTDENRINMITSYMSDKNYEVLERLSGNDFLFKLKK
jgi:FkbM family methyltransferase